MRFFLVLTDVVWDCLGGRPGRCTKYASLKAVRPSVMPVRRAQLVRMCAEEDVAPKEEVVQKAPEVPVPTAQEAAVPAAEDPYGDLPPERYPGYYKVKKGAYRQQLDRSRTKGREILFLEAWWMRTDYYKRYLTGSGTVRIGPTGGNGQGSKKTQDWWQSKSIQGRWNSVCAMDGRNSQ